MSGRGTAGPAGGPALRRHGGPVFARHSHRVIHDVYAATPECAVDPIRNGTFFHFWSEVLADTSVADDVPCPRCMASGS